MIRNKFKLNLKEKLEKVNFIFTEKMVFTLCQANKPYQQSFRIITQKMYSFKLVYLQ